MYLLPHATCSSANFTIPSHTLPHYSPPRFKTAKFSEKVSRLKPCINSRTSPFPAIKDILAILAQKMPLKNMTDSCTIRPLMAAKPVRQNPLNRLTEKEEDN